MDTGTPELPLTVPEEKSELPEVKSTSQMIKEIRAEEI